MSVTHATPRTRHDDPNRRIFPGDVFGLVAEFDSPEAVLKAAEAAHEAGYRELDAFSPIPVDGLAEAIGFKRNWVALIILIGGLTGGLGGFYMQWFSAVIHYPVIIGGRPLNSWPSFMPIVFELTVLISAFSAVFGMLGLNGLPRPNHPIFNTPGFDRASQDRFFLSVHSNDPQYDEEQTRRFLEGQDPVAVSLVPF